MQFTHHSSHSWMNSHTKMINQYIHGRICIQIDNIQQMLGNWGSVWSKYIKVVFTYCHETWLLSRSKWRKLRRIKDSTMEQKSTNYQRRAEQGHWIVLEWLGMTTWLRQFPCTCEELTRYYGHCTHNAHTWWQTWCLFTYYLSTQNISRLDFVSNSKSILFHRCEKISLIKPILDFQY